MSLGTRLSDLLARRRRGPDPLEQLDAAYEEQAEALRQSRRGVADVVTARKRVELQARSLEGGAARLRDEAQAEVDAGREDAARALLSRRGDLLAQAAALQPDLERLRQQESRLQAQVQRLEAKVDAFRAQRETLKATHSAAEAHTRISEAWAGVSEESADVGLALRRARDRTEALQARADALDALAAPDAAALPGETAGESAERRLAALAGDGVEDELARLRRSGPAGGADRERGAAT
jgi:phage shock protein A